MQAYAEGFELMHHSEFDARPRRDRGHLALRLRRPLVAARAPARGARAARRRARRHRAATSRTRARAAGRSTRRSTTPCRCPRSPPRSSPLRLAPRDRLLGEGAGRAAQPVRRPRGPGGRAGEAPERRSPRMQHRARTRCSRGCGSRRTPGAVRARHLRRLRRPHAAASSSRRSTRSPSARLLPERFGIVGVARTEQTTKDWVAAMKEAVQEYGRDEFRADVWDELAAGMRYVATDFADDEGEDARRRGARASSTRSAARRATASTTSPSRRPRSRRSSTKLGERRSDATAGRG